MHKYIFMQKIFKELILKTEMNAKNINIQEYRLNLFIKLSIN